MSVYIYIYTFLICLFIYYSTVPAESNRPIFPTQIPAAITTNDLNSVGKFCDMKGTSP